MLINDSRPLMSLIVEDKQFEALVDTGADVSVISLQQWPNDWKKEKSPLVLTGLRSIADVWRKALNLCHVNCLMERKYLFLFTLLIYLLISGEGIFIFYRNNAHHLIGKLVATAQIPRALPLKWLTDVPKRVEQWPLPKVKLEILEQLVEE